MHFIQALFYGLIFHNKYYRVRTAVCIWCMLLGILSNALFPLGIAYGQTLDDQSAPAQEQEALVCSAMPIRMASFVRMQNEIMNALVIQEEDPLLDIPAGAWQSGQYRVDKRLKRLRRLLQPNLLEQAWDGLVADAENKRNGISTTLIMSTVQIYSTTLDGIRGLMSILYQSRPVIRDMKRLYAIDVRLGEKIDELGLQGYFFAPIPDAIVDDLNTIADKYEGNGQIFTQLRFQPGVRYDNVIGIILLWNEIHKGFLADGGIKRFIPDKHEVETASGDDPDSIIYEFGALYASSLQQEYKPARQLRCNPIWEQLTDNLAALNEATGERAQNITRTIEDSIVRLQGISLGYDTQGDTQAQQAYIQREYELLRSMYGLDVQRKLRGSFVETETSSNSASVQAGVGVSTLWRSLIAQQQKDEDSLLQPEQEQEEAIERARNNQAPALDLRAQVRDAARTQQREERSFIRNATSTSPSVYYAAPEGNVITDMVQAATSVAQLHEQATLQTLVSQPSDTTQTLGAILQEVRRTQARIQGQDNEDNLVELLGQACELQCSNLGGDCRDNSG